MGRIAAQKLCIALQQTEFVLFDTMVGLCRQRLLNMLPELLQPPFCIRRACRTGDHAAIGMLKDQVLSHPDQRKSVANS